MPAFDNPETRAKAAATRARNRSKKLKLAKVKIPVAMEAKDRYFPTKKKLSIVETLKSIDWQKATYEEVAQAMPVLRVVWEEAANACNQKQSVLEASSRRVPCSTCGSLVDISASGKFQQKTVRNPITYNPMNVYFCSQNCIQGYEAKLLADSQKKQMRA